MFVSWIPAKRHPSQPSLSLLGMVFWTFLFFLTFPQTVRYLWPTHGKQPLASGRHHFKIVTERKGITQQFSTKVEIASPLAMSGDISGVTTGREAASNIQWVEARHAAKHPPMHKTVPTKRIILPKISIVLPLKSPGFKSQQAKKPCNEREG